MEIFSSLFAIGVLILIALTILMPVFVYKISGRAKDLSKLAEEQMEWNRCQLEAQNKILQELYNIRTK